MFNIILSNLHLEKIWWIIKRKLKFIILITLLCALLGGTYAYLNRHSTYLASISFYVVSDPDYVSDSSVNIESSELTQAQYLVSSYMQILSSDSFLQEVATETGLDYSTEQLRNTISAEAIEDTAVFKVHVIDALPKNAKTIANAIAELAPAEITRIVKAGGIEVIDRAKLPTTPYASTSVIKFIAIGGLGGLVLSLAWFVIRGLLDTRIRRKYEIEEMFKIPILGDIPWLETDTKSKDDGRLLNENSPFAMRESYNNIATKLLFTAKGEKCPVYGITSTMMGEGKSLTAVNVVKAFSMLSKKVLLIDADMRKGDVVRKMHIRRSNGLSQYLSGIDKNYELRIMEDNFHVLTAGDVPPNPSELLAAEAWSELLTELKTRYDAIFVDLPPVGIVADALIIAPTVTTYMIPICQGVTKFDKEKEVIRQLEMVNADICGFIFNGVSLKSADYSYKGYAYEYKYGEKNEKVKSAG